VREKALLITVDISSRKSQPDTGWHVEERADELRELALSSGAGIVKEMILKRQHPSPAHFIGSGQAEAIKDICLDLSVDAVIFNNDLTGSQQKSLEDIIGVKTVDRTQLILDIFARRARSNEGKLQVELAQLMYLLPRLIGQGIFLSRLGGGIGTRGPGEQKLEVDRRKIRTRIAKLKKELDNVAMHRHISRKQRAEFSLLTIAIIGYTNAGKSTLLNALTGSNVVVQDKLFCTLDPTIRSYLLPNNQKVIFSDTVGFLDRLPHNVIEAFKATLEEVVDADLLIHVIDVNHPKRQQHRKAVQDVLKELGAQDRPVIQVLNKIDMVEDSSRPERFGEEFDDAVCISALHKKGLTELIDKIILHITKEMVVMNIEVPQYNMKAVRFVHEHAHIIKKEYRGQNVYFEVQIPTQLKTRLEKLTA